jgi:hypothetical protein
MSDDEYEYDYGSDAEEETYSDGGEGNESSGVTDELIEIENAFYGKLSIQQILL